MKKRPNILLLMTDEQRGDCLGIEGHPVLQTPNLDHLAASGTRFTNGYSACPVCIPARRTLMTGQRPAAHGVFVNYSTRLDGATLPGELTKAGYQTHLVGKLHLHPKRKLYGFMSADWADGPRADEPKSDYERFLEKQGLNIPRVSVAHGVNGNGWVSRPYHLDERYHFTNWCVDKALEFLERRDPTTPFFLKVSFHQPHQPCTPPTFYYDRYINMDIPEPYVGDWASVYEEYQRGLPIAAWRVKLEPTIIKQYRAGYYGCINHIDDQIGRLLNKIPEDTIIVFCSDHGEMLGDHQWIRKRTAFEPSARIPYIIKLPNSMGIEQGAICENVVGLMDIMPTLLDAVGIDIPDSVDGGRSIIPLLQGENEWREYFHGECSTIPTLNSGMQYLTDGKRKYIWYPGKDEEQYFDLENDPQEMHNLIDNKEYMDEIVNWRSILARELAGRPEGFSDGKSLIGTEGPTASCLPEYLN